jgi:hypothetical protein
MKGKTLQRIKDRSAWNLAADAGCGSPASETSAGAMLLAVARDVFVRSAGQASSPDDIVYVGGSYCNQALDLPSYHIGTAWVQFIDLGAWQEDPPDGGDWPTSLCDAARMALSAILARLFFSLQAELLECQEDDA